MLHCARQELGDSARIGGPTSSSSKGELSLLEVVLLLLLSESFAGQLVLGQSPSESAGLLAPQVEGGPLLLSGLVASLVYSLLVDHSQNLSDRLSHELYTGA